MPDASERTELVRPVQVPVDSQVLQGELRLPPRAQGVVLFAHGSGSSRHSPRNRYVAQTLRDGGMATLLMDLLTPEEEQADAVTAHLRFDIALLADRLVRATQWLVGNPETAELSIGYFGASTGGGAALVAAAHVGPKVGAVVSRGGRPDLAGPSLSKVEAPTLLIVGERDVPVIRMNRDAMALMHAPVQLEIVPGATHLFEEPGALGEVAALAQRFFKEHLGAVRGTGQDG